MLALTLSVVLAGCAGGGSGIVPPKPLLGAGVDDGL